MNKLIRERSDGADAFIPESAQITGTLDDLAEFLGEQYLREAFDDDRGESSRDQAVTEELGGPFVESRPEEEFGPTRGGGNAAEIRAELEESPTRPLRCPLPQAVASLAIAAPDEDGQGDEAGEDAERVSSLEPDIRLDGPTSTG